MLKHLIHLDNVDNEMVIQISVEPKGTPDISQVVTIYAKTSGFDDPVEMYLSLDEFDTLLGDLKELHKTAKEKHLKSILVDKPKEKEAEDDRPGMPF